MLSHKDGRYEDSSGARTSGTRMSLLFTLAYTRPPRVVALLNQDPNCCPRQSENLRLR